jgi:hypothetical protein
MITVALVGTSFAADPAVLEAVKTTAELRSLRIAPGAPKISDAEYLRAGAGEIVTGLLEVEGVAARKAYGVTVMDLDISSLWAAVNDESRAADFTAIDYSEIVHGKPCEDGRKTLQFLPVPFITDRWWITILDVNEALIEKSAGVVREVAWTSSTDAALVTSDKGKETIAAATPLGWTKGGWYVTKVDATHTLVEYYVWSDPGGSVPAGATSWFASSSVTDALEAIEEFARKGSPRCTKF